MTTKIDSADLMRDEFIRIANSPGATLEIIGLARRALIEIESRFPVLAERDRLEASNAALRNHLVLVLETIKKHRWKVNTDEEDTIQDAINYLYKKTI